MRGGNARLSIVVISPCRCRFSLRDGVAQARGLLRGRCGEWQPQAQGMCAGGRSVGTIHSVWGNSKRFARPHQPLGARWPRAQQKQQEEAEEAAGAAARARGQGMGPGQQRCRSLRVHLRRSAHLSCGDYIFCKQWPPLWQSVKRCEIYIRSNPQKVIQARISAA